MKTNLAIKSRLSFLVVVLLVGVLISSCLKTEDEFVPSEAALSIVNAYSGNASVNFYLDNQKVNIQPLLYMQNTEYIQVFSGKRRLTITKGGLPGSVLIDSAVGVAPKKYYTLYLFRKNAENPNQVEHLLMEDNFTSPSSGKAKVRFIDLVPDAPSVNIYLRSETGESVKLFANNTFKTVTDFIEVESGLKRYEVRKSDSDSGPIVEYNFEAGKVYTVYATGLWNGNIDQGQMLSIQTIVNK